MKKLLLLGLILSTLFSCGNLEDNKGQVFIYDNANVLSEEAKTKLNATDFLNQLVVIYTVDSLNFGDLNTECTALFDRFSTELDSIQLGALFSRYGMLILSSKNPNYCVAKLGDYYEINGCEPEQYCSREYYRQQVSKDESPQTKILGTLEKAMRYCLNYSAIVNYCRDELLGLIIPIVRPDDSFLYKYIIRPFQYPFVIAMNVVKSFWLAILLVTIILYSLTFGIARWVLNPSRNILKLDNNEVSNKYKIQTASGCIAGLIYNIPMMVGGLSLALYFGSSGIEFIPDLVNYINLPLETIEEAYSGYYSRGSSLMACLVVIFFYYSNYVKEDEDRISSNMKLVIFSFVFFLLPMSVLLFLLCYFAPSFIWGIKRFYQNDEGYLDLRVSGLSKLSAIFISSLRPLGLVLGCLIGFYAGTGSQDFHIESITQEIQTNASQIDVKDAINYWYLNQKKE